MQRHTLRQQTGLIAALTTLIWTLTAGAQATAQDMTDREPSSDRHKATSRQSIEWWNSDSNVDPDDLYAPGYVNHQEPIAASDGEKGVTLPELKTIVTSYHTAFPGTKVEFQMQIAEGDRVATHWTFTAVQKGEYEGLAPTNKTVTWSGISIDEYNAAGKITQSWVVWDKFTMFQTLGLIQ
ncbi:MAG: ester cyclase [Pseudomonadota bacterium]